MNTLHQSAHHHVAVALTAIAFAGVCAPLASAGAWAQPVPPTMPAAPLTPPAVAASAAPITYASVADALSALQAKDGTETIVVHTDGWVIINEPAAKAQWSFTPASHPAYPAVVRRIIRRGPNRDVSVETSSLCEAPAAACDGLLTEFAAMDQRVTDAVRGRGQAPVVPRQP